MADIHILVADDAAGQRLDAYLAPMTLPYALCLRASDRGRRRNRERRDLFVKKVCRTRR